MYSCKNFERILQGDIYKDITITLKLEELPNGICQDKIIYPYILILTQDCDLEQDYNTLNSEKQNRNFINTILTCPIFPAHDLREGTHFSELNLNFERINSKLWDPIKKNNNFRYHYLKNFDFEEDSVSISNSENHDLGFVLDFKHFHTISKDTLYSKKENYVTSINPLFREQISQRFAYYLSRIGLPYSCKGCPPK